MLYTPDHIEDITDGHTAALVVFLFVPGLAFLPRHAALWVLTWVVIIVLGIAVTRSAPRAAYFTYPSMYLAAAAAAEGLGRLAFMRWERWQPRLITLAPPDGRSRPQGMGGAWRLARGPDAGAKMVSWVILSGHSFRPWATALAIGLLAAMVGTQPDVTLWEQPTSTPVLTCIRQALGWMWTAYVALLVGRAAVAFRAEPRET